MSTARKSADLPVGSRCPMSHSKWDIREHLRVGDNVVAITIHHYRRKGQLPLSAVLDPNEDCEIYRRSLDLRNAICRVHYMREGVGFTREAFASAPDQVMAFRIAADKPGSVSFTASLDRMEDFETRADGPAGLIMTGNTASGRTDAEGMKFVARLRAIEQGGKVTVVDGALRVESADEVILLIAAATNYQGFAGRGTADPLKATSDDIGQASTKSFEELRSNHIADYRSYFDRVGVGLDDGRAESREAAKLATDERLERLPRAAPIRPWPHSISISAATC
jgi:alpha-L-fucosidase 2